MKVVAVIVVVTAMLLPRVAAAVTLPDQPGAIASTSEAEVCTPGYASRVRPRGEAWRTLKRALYARYGFARGHYGYVADHIVPLELGGAPTDLQNLWLEPYDDAHAKDRVENELHILVCDGRMPLRDAQVRIARDWTTAVPAGMTLTARERAQTDRENRSDY